MTCGTPPIPKGHFISRRRSYLQRSVHELWHATNDENPHPRRWRDSPLPIWERGLGGEGYFQRSLSYGYTHYSPFKNIRFNPYPE